LDSLLAEIRVAIGKDGTDPISVPRATPTQQLADTIYRPFFRAGIAVALTLGAGWGVWLLLRIALGGTFRAVTLHEVNAHGHAQIFGWVGLFVMGFAYQAFSRFKHTDLAHPRAAYTTLWLMLGGIAGRSLLEPFCVAVPWLGVPAVAASVVEIVAIVLFVWVVLATLRSSSRGLECYDYYALSALAWFVIQAVWETVYFTATILAADREHLLDLVATWQGPLRDIQIHGFALLMILGASQRIFHYFYGFPTPNRRKSMAAWVALNVAVVGEVAGFVLMRTAGHAWAVLWYGSILLLAAATAILVADWHIFSGSPESDRSLKFLRAAYVWLFVALGMLVLLPVYQFGLLARLAPASLAAQIGFSHAYYGAIRHAITVGFVSLMIVGVAGKVVPTLMGIDVHKLRGLWLPFVLLNSGCALRVILQTLTDFTPAAYPLAGASGLLEFAGLTIWGVHLWRMMSPQRQTAPTGAGSELLPIVSMGCSRPGNTPNGIGGGDTAPPITADHNVAEVIGRYPELLDTFIAAGFQPLKNAMMRATVARCVTIRRACGMHGVKLEPFLGALNVHRQRSNTCVNQLS
jgi:hypothetical protein